MKVTSVVLALGLGAALSGAQSARAEDVPVTLAEALALAGQANPELQAASARVDAQAARTESVRRMRRPRLGLSMGWSRMDMPAGVFASKLNSGQFTAADFDVARINDPGALNHLGTNLVARGADRRLRQGGQHGDRHGRLRRRRLGGDARRGPGDPAAGDRGLPAGRDGGPGGRGHRARPGRREGARGGDRGARRDGQRPPGGPPPGPGATPGARGRPRRAARPAADGPGRARAAPRRAGRGELRAHRGAARRASPRGRRGRVGRAGRSASGPCSRPRAARPTPPRPS